MKSLCDIRKVCFSYNASRTILRDVSFSVFENEIVGILGKNGSGKSTLLNVVTGFLPCAKGTIFVGGKSIKAISLSERAKLLSYIQQSKIRVPSYYRLEDFIIEGRRPFRSFGLYTHEDYELLDKTINDCDLADFRDSYVKDLSGGEFQRCLFARALMKQSQFYLFDEPCSAMDIKYQKEFFKIATKVKDTMRAGILITIHDINLAVQNCDRLILLNDGSIVFDGKARDVSADIISKTFDIEVSTSARGKKYFYY